MPVQCLLTMLCNQADMAVSKQAMFTVDVGQQDQALNHGVTTAWSCDQVSVAPHHRSLVWDIPSVRAQRDGLCLHRHVTARLYLVTINYEVRIEMYLLLISLENVAKSIQIVKNQC